MSVLNTDLVYFIILIAALIELLKKAQDRKRKTKLS